MPKRKFDFCFVLSDLLVTTPRALRVVQFLLAQGHSVAVVANWRMKHAIVSEVECIQGLKSESFYYKNIEWRGISPMKLISKALQVFCQLLAYDLQFKGTVVTWFALDYTILRQMWLSKNIEAKVYIGHRPSSLPTVTYLQEKNGGKTWFDIEDEHFVESQQKSLNRLMAFLIKENKCDVYTSASRLVGESFCNHMGFSSNVSVEILNSTSETVSIQPETYGTESPLRFVWFSQSVAFNRGLEEFFDALKVSNIQAEVHLIGFVFPEFKDWLSKKSLPQVTIQYHGFIPEKQIIQWCQQSDVGLALERSDVDESRNLSITNKILTYAVCGNFILASHTQGQTDFLERLPENGISTTLKLKAISDVLLSLHYERKLIRQNKFLRQHEAQKVAWPAQEQKLKELLAGLL